MAVSEGEKARIAAGYSKYLGKFYEYIISDAGKAVSPDSPDHPNNLWQAGRELLTATTNLGLDNEGVAKAVQVDPADLVAYENGIIPPSSMPEGFRDKINNFLQKVTGRGQETVVFSAKESAPIPA